MDRTHIRLLQQGSPRDAVHRVLQPVHSGTNAAGVPWVAVPIPVVAAVAVAAVMIAVYHDAIVVDLLFAVNEVPVIVIFPAAIATTVRLIIHLDQAETACGG